MHLKKELGANIRKYRKLNKMTQEKLAELVDVEINSISSIETGKFFPSPDNLVKISNALDISLSDLFTFYNSSTCESYIEEINKNIAIIQNNKEKLGAINTFIKHIVSLS